MLRKAFALLTGQTEEPNSPKPPSEDNHQSYRHTISEDERRLLPDYAQPADAIELPQPEEWAYGQEPSVAIMKPKSTRQLLPLDTMTPRNSRRHSPPPPKRLTFDPSHRATKAYGDSDNEQLQFLKEYETGRGVRSGVMALEDRPGRSIKRRKIYDTSDANAVIDLDADELASTETPAETAWRFARPSTSSRQESILRSTQQSVGTNGGSYARSGGAPVSGFRQTCDITSPHRKKRRRKPNAENGTARRASEEASHGVPSTYDVSDDSDIELLPAQSTSRGKEQPTIREKGETELRLLQSLNPDDSSDLVENPPVSSRFFPKPGFDTFSRTPNSSQRGAASVKGPSKGNPKSRSLRDATFRKGIPTFDENANEPAEAYTAATTPSEFYQSSSHASMHHVKARGQLRYSLFLLRADDVHTSGTDLCLKQKNRGPFNQAEFELVRLSKQTEPIATFNMRNIVALETDSELLVRLKGPENKSGPEFIYDLQFEDPSDCGDFLRRALLSLKAVERDRYVHVNIFWHTCSLNKYLHAKSVQDASWSASITRYPYQICFQLDLAR
ncbi:hypothetical protein M011DRAFT_298403 [Sporormia fimetaria CBS 119925]|uniref:Uncharacterized protein n=1 Tax=Sporormia fimetaria CBS 119925 TaxID=1340428 RepID=A0A6A6UW49_9PLEO|nr:hypothetical protein M011DRAFT_298403 [Sporormia fimetaria CBS 119925]